MKRAYTIKCNNEKSDYEQLKSKMVNNNPLKHLGFNEVTCFDLESQLEFIIVDDTIIGKINTALSQFGFNITINDVTNDLLLNKIDLNNINKSVLNDIKEFYFETFDRDDILDKISQMGIESMTKFDTMILSN